MSIPIYFARTQVIKSISFRLSVNNGCWGLPPPPRSGIGFREYISPVWGGLNPLPSCEKAVKSIPFWFLQFHAHSVFAVYCPDFIHSIHKIYIYRDQSRTFRIDQSNTFRIEQSRTFRIDQSNTFRIDQSRTFRIDQSNTFRIDQSISLKI